MNFRKKTPTSFRLAKETLDRLAIMSKELSEKSKFKLSQSEVVDLLVADAAERNLIITMKLSDECIATTTTI